MTYTEFKRMHIDLGALGAEGGRNAVRYTCLLYTSDAADE